MGLSPATAAQGSEASPAARNTLDSARIPRASKLLICGLFQKGRVLAQDAVALHFMYYNFARIHTTLRVTPAMEAGVADHVWSLE